MDGGGVGQRQLVEFRVLVLDAVAIERDSQRPLLRVNMLHRADVAIEHVLVVVVAYLHHAIAPTVLESATRKAVANGVDSLLKGDVQVRGSHHTALHRGQHLDVVGADVVSLGYAVAHDVHDFLRRPLGVFLLNKEEVGRAPVADIGESSLVDLVGIGDDTARLRLAEDARQSDDGNCARVDDVAEHVACSHAG